jgi:hypothetical protein
MSGTIFKVITMEQQVQPEWEPVESISAIIAGIEPLS